MPHPLDKAKIAFPCKQTAIVNFKWTKDQRFYIIFLLLEINVAPNKQYVAWGCVQYTYLLEYVANNVKQLNLT